MSPSKLIECIIAQYFNFKNVRFIVLLIEMSIGGDMFKEIKESHFLLF